MELVVCSAWCYDRIGWTPVFLFLPVDPEVIGIEDNRRVRDCEKNDTDVPLLENRSDSREEAVGFIQAWRIAGVAPFALCLFFFQLPTGFHSTSATHRAL